MHCALFNTLSLLTHFTTLTIPVPARLTNPVLEMFPSKGMVPSSSCTWTKSSSIINGRARPHYTLWLWTLVKNEDFQYKVTAIHSLGLSMTAIIMLLFRQQAQYTATSFPSSAACTTCWGICEEGSVEFFQDHSIPWSSSSVLCTTFLTSNVSSFISSKSQWRLQPFF